MCIYCIVINHKLLRYIWDGASAYNALKSKLEKQTRELWIVLIAGIIAQYCKFV